MHACTHLMDDVGHHVSNADGMADSSHSPACCLPPHFVLFHREGHLRIMHVCGGVCGGGNMQHLRIMHACMCRVGWGGGGGGHMQHFRIMVCVCVWGHMHPVYSQAMRVHPAQLTQHHERGTEHFQTHHPVLQGLAIPRRERQA